MTMTDPEKLEFVCSLTESVKNDLAKALRAGSVPANWDGMELRQWLADKFTAVVSPMIGKRMRDYVNDVLIDPKL